VTQVLENNFYHYFCSVCREKADNYCRSLKPKDSKIIWMKLAFKYELWKNLNQDEVNFLKAIYYLHSWNRIYHELINLDLNYGLRTLFKLDSMNLIFYDKNSSGNHKTKMLPELEKIIQEKKI
jgi:hypothetical protein